MTFIKWTLVAGIEIFQTGPNRNSSNMGLSMLRETMHTQTCMYVRIFYSILLELKGKQFGVCLSVCLSMSCEKRPEQEADFHIGNLNIFFFFKKKKPKAPNPMRFTNTCFQEAAGSV